jgi:Formyl transferase
MSASRVVLICHADDPINRLGIASWLATCFNLAGIIEIHEDGTRAKQRIKRELKRVGWLRMLDVLAFRLYYKLRMAAKDRTWEERTVGRLQQQYPADLQAVPVLQVSSPNSPEAHQFLERCQPDWMLARCKTLLKESLFSLPPVGTFVLHPGICPQYRNAHGCFWAIANGDAANVGATLLKIDRGIDTGPIYGFYRPEYHPQTQSHLVIQHLAVLDYLPQITTTMQQVVAGTAVPCSVSSQHSQEWGQPWLTAYWRYASAKPSRPEHVGSSCQPRVGEAGQRQFVQVEG